MHTSLKSRSKVYAQDFFTIFTQLGLENPAAGKRYIDDILAPAGELEPDVLVNRFLGRRMRRDAFYALVGITANAVVAPLAKPRRLPAGCAGWEMKLDGKALGIVLALVYIFLWASAYVPSKIGVLDSSPLWFLVVRFAVAAGVLAVIAVALHAHFPQSARGWLAAAALGLLANAAYLGLTYEALRHLASGIGAIVASTNPLVLALVAPVVLHERLGVQKIAGMLLGFGGVVAIVLVRAGGGTAEPRDVALAFAGVIASVAGTIVYKRWCAGENLVALTTVQLAVASIALLPLALVFEGVPRVNATPRLAVSFVYLVVALSVGASLLWFWLLRHGDASRVSAYYFLTPVFGLGISAAILHESVTPRDLGGLVAIVAGIALVQRS